MSETAILRYVVRPERLEEHLELLAAVYAELHDTRPAGLRFASYRLEDGTSFVELASADPLPGPLLHLSSFRRYRAELEARCSERSFWEVTVAGSYGW